MHLCVTCARAVLNLTGKDVIGDFRCESLDSSVLGLKVPCMTLLKTALISWLYDSGLVVPLVMLAHQLRCSVSCWGAGLEALHGGSSRIFPLTVQTEPPFLASPLGPFVWAAGSCGCCSGRSHLPLLS